MRWPFEKEYDVFVVDYKLVIKENLLYKQVSSAIFWVCFCIFCTSIFFALFALSFYVGLLVVITELSIVAKLISNMKPAVVIEIDNAAKTIRVRDEHDVMRKDVLCIKVSNERDSRDYIANYLTLITEVMGQLCRYHVMTVDKHFDYAHETFEIAGLIAEKLDLELIIEHPQVFSFRSMFKAEEKPPGKVYR
ncbi:MAG TPA: hypothetical protein VK154_13910 [Chitinophagales bacterium]|nr:hypothetical protein [Chitinophagales bacterium]